MDRELVLAVLVAVLCGAAQRVAAWWPTGVPVAASGRRLERCAWRHLWMPFAPTVFLLAGLCGWAVMEPARAERLPDCLLWSAVPFSAIVVRAMWRAVYVLWRCRHEHTIATAGLFVPRIIVPRELAAALDAASLRAALAHERAHVRHRDPLRLWLAQLATDLLWPSQAAQSRFLYWRRALELARDEEARLDGVPGPDLAAAILAVLRPSRGTPLAVASLGGDASVVEERIAHLLRPLAVEAPRRGNAPLWLAAAIVSLAAAVVLGCELGEPAMRVLLAIV